jgi:hypothetical protein
VRAPYCVHRPQRPRCARILQHGSRSSQRPGRV